jgi:hypothetical protein
MHKKGNSTFTANKGAFKSNLSGSFQNNELSHKMGVQNPDEMVLKNDLEYNFKNNSAIQQYQDAKKRSLAPLNSSKLDLGFKAE